MRSGRPAPAAHRRLRAAFLAPPGRRAWSRYAGDLAFGAYAGALVFAPGLPPGVLAATALAGGLATGVLVRDRGVRSGRAVTAGWATAHLAVLATGGAGTLATPVLAASAAWAGAVRSGRWLLAAAGAATVALVGADLWTGLWTVRGALEGMVALVVGGAGGSLWQRTVRRDEERDRHLDRILREAEEGGRIGPVAVARRLDALGEALELARTGLGLERAVVWDVDAQTNRARPRAVAGGAAPPDVHLGGSALGWVWEETMPVRLDVRPSWALDDVRVGAVAVVPGSERYALLTLEWDEDDTAIGLHEIRQAGHYLAMYARMEVEREAGEVTRAGFEEMLAFVRALPGETRPDAFPEALARTAATIAGGTGALVARCEEESAQVLAVAGRDGGPVVGTYSDGGSTCGDAIRTGTVVRREQAGGRGQRPLVRSGERWQASPRAVVAIPLLDETGRARGILAVWNADAPELDPAAMELLEVFAPIFALQLQQGTDLVTLRKRAEIDALTGLANRGILDRELKEAAKHFRRYRRSFALLVMDLDRFKAINDTHGHAAGDAVLRVVGGIVAGAIREVDTAARSGGEEFVLLLPETMRAAAVDVAERLRETVEDTPVLFGGEEIRITASFGVSACPECVDDPDGLMASADAMLYESKEAGRNRVTAAAVG